ncbi:MAG: OB-fold nucleic acid binding domain-containing protein, partial [Hyphomicrobiales bacterium]
MRPARARRPLVFPIVKEKEKEGAEIDLPAVMRDRREKLERLRASGIEPYSRGFRPTQTTQSARDLLGESERTGQVSLAGRLMVKRVQGGLVFADVQDGRGRIQLMATRELLGDEEFGRFADLDAGDIVGATGPVFRTRRGEVTLEVQSFQLLTKSLRPLPEKWHGLKDVEIRYRQRYVDLIANPQVRDVF